MLTTEREGRRTPRQYKDTVPARAPVRLDDRRLRTGQPPRLVIGKRLSAGVARITGERGERRHVMSSHEPIPILAGLNRSSWEHH